MICLHLGGRLTQHNFPSARGKRKETMKRCAKMCKSVLKSGLANLLRAQPQLFFQFVDTNFRSHFQFQLWSAFLHYVCCLPKDSKITSTVFKIVFVFKILSWEPEEGRRKYLTKLSQERAFCVPSISHRSATLVAKEIVLLPTHPERFPFHAGLKTTNQVRVVASDFPWNFVHQIKYLWNFVSSQVERRKEIQFSHLMSS